jgi:hypothetical protein
MSQKLQDTLPWLIPLAITMLIAFAQMYELKDRVDKIESVRNTRGEAAIKKVNDLENRVAVIESYFCYKVEGCEDKPK